MSPINLNSVNKKLSRLQTNITKLESYKKVSQNDFLVDFTINAAAMHYLVENIEIITDIGNHILAEDFGDSGDSYKDIIKKTGENKIIPLKFAKDNMDMAGLRNMIIHFYVDIEMKKIYQSLQKAPDIFKKFAKYYINYLNKNNI